MTAANRLASSHRPQAGSIENQSLVVLGRPRSGPRRDWSDLLRDLTNLDHMRIETAMQCAQLRQSVHLQGIRVQNGFGLAVGRHFRLHALLERWHRLRPLVDQQSLAVSGIRIEDTNHRALLDLRVDSDEDRSTLAELLDRYHSEPARILPHQPFGWRNTPPAAPSNLGCMDCKWRSDCGTHEMIDVARVCEWPLDVGMDRSLDRNTTALAAASTLELLRIVADQALPIRLLTGTPGAAQRFDGAFQRLEHKDDGSLALIGDAVEFHLHPSRMGSAHIAEHRTHSGRHRQVWLRTPRGRTWAILEDLPGFCETETPLWRTLINSLTD
ncbi:hypothetical protein ThidrDRAFT_1768 [Thiorhodococcus drewsii AZ1]|uniref:Haemin-degrading HemS/ChuX domain-containing protein n=1 Tax=Thiorhodococcus drewsii AZ1 TaxID=765913 RepID=G2E0F5_9GAMM|nr:hypothetical protein [Thiorhodococcus drewsii]EGV31883.1 hypothetical protein ThidrDRAFT_1768 [Thiorhodococcus drewsii AZ1]